MKKWYPKYRHLPEDDAKVMLNFFIKEKYPYNSLIIADNNFEEHVFLIISGEVSGIKNLKHLPKLSKKIEDTGVNKKDYSHIVLEKYRIILN